ncbi:hypothetical protein QQY79_01290 [Flavobacterium tructae]|uniref:hypothetical protein n=1 Tax=Flavobacterium tructae TaxID=1114873 RepID=UPI002551FE1A|nr:hypothetical protein [Flavobacterium tructae]MDL2141139.1 hypothetical protein [Flavobacterium tructae]
MNNTIRYTSSEIFEIFKEQHRLCSSLDPETDESFVLKTNTEIRDWRRAGDLVKWDKLAEFLSREFRINETSEKWDSILNPEKKKTLGDLCDFLSTTAEKEIINPIKILGNECLSAATFIALKRNLKDKGVDVADLRPSTKIKDFLDVYENFSPLMEEVTLTGVRVFDKLEYEKQKPQRRYKYWIDQILPIYVYKKSSVTTGEIETFRDLIQKIVENEKLGVTV